MDYPIFYLYSRKKEASVDEMLPNAKRIRRQNLWNKNDLITHLIKHYFITKVDETFQMFIQHMKVVSLSLFMVVCKAK